MAPLSLAYLPSTEGVDLRLTAWNVAADEADRLLRGGIERLRECAAEWGYGEGNSDLGEVVAQQLRASGRQLAVAESCTGGLLGGRLTDTPGASDVFLGGVIAYSNHAKEAIAVSPDLIAAHGAVSSEVAAAMASGVAAGSGAQVSVSITGIAGPGGGTEEKPVGTVWFGWSIDGVVSTQKAVFGGTRREIRERAVQAALFYLWRALKQQP